MWIHIRVRMYTVRTQVLVATCKFIRAMSTAADVITPKILNES